SGMAVEAQAGIAQVKISVEQLDGPGRRILARLRLKHGGRVPAVILVGAADRVAQRPGPAIGRPDDAFVGRRPSVAIDRRVGRHRGAGQRGIDVGGGPPGSGDKAESMSVRSSPSSSGPTTPWNT